MKISENGDELMISETPGCVWIFGLFFAVIGACFVYLSLGGASNFHETPTWQLFMAFFFGAVGVAAGLFIIYYAPLTRIVFRRYDNTVIYTRLGLFGRKRTIYAFDEIKRFCVLEDKDDEDNAIWSLGLETTTGETIKISALPVPVETAKLDVVLRANQFMCKEIPSFKDKV